MLQQIIEGCGEAFQPHVTQELQDVTFRALLHQNRFVRETCYHTLAALCALCTREQLLQFADTAAEHLQDGLNENWSQVSTSISSTMHSLSPFHQHSCAHMCTSQRCCDPAGAFCSLCGGQELHAGSGHR